MRNSLILNELRRLLLYHRTRRVSRTILLFVYLNPELRPRKKITFMRLGLAPTVICDIVTP